MTRGYIPYSVAWGLEVILKGMITRGCVIYGHSDETVGIM